MRIVLYARESVMRWFPTAAPLLLHNDRPIIVCERCALVRSGRGNVARVGSTAMLAHLSEHERYGYRVPPRVYRCLEMLAFSERGGAW